MSGIPVECAYAGNRVERFIVQKPVLPKYYYLISIITHMLIFVNEYYKNI